MKSLSWALNRAFGVCAELVETTRVGLERTGNLKNPAMGCGYLSLVTFMKEFVI
jgi:hypothetical protein